MGEHYTTAIRCDWCGEMNKEVWYAPSSDVTEFTCDYCQKPNDIVLEFRSRKPARSKTIKKGQTNG